MSAGTLPSDPVRNQGLVTLIYGHRAPEKRAKSPNLGNGVVFRAHRRDETTAHGPTRPGFVREWCPLGEIELSSAGAETPPVRAFSVRGIRDWGRTRHRSRCRRIRKPPPNARPPCRWRPPRRPGRHPFIDRRTLDDDVEYTQTRLVRIDDRLGKQQAHDLLDLCGPTRCYVSQ